MGGLSNRVLHVPGCQALGDASKWMLLGKMARRSLWMLAMAAICKNWAVIIHMQPVLRMPGAGGHLQVDVVR